tara:strand:- start:1299 stop:2093 length:795 start_codon:yes stop_codon:yes gene_type:complete
MIIKKAYVVGTNVSKSLSPLIFNYWFKKYNIDGAYYYKQIKEKNFNFEIKKILKEEGVCGINVTIPFKEKIIKHLNKQDRHSKLIGAVNCVSVSEKKIEGTNTDWTGFRECTKHIKKRRAAVVLGYGGSAKAVIYSLRQMGFKKIRVFNRTFNKIKKLRNIKPHKLEEISDYFYAADIIVNTIPKDIIGKLLKIKRKSHNKPKKTGHGLDLVYNSPNLFLKHISKNRKIYGVQMLAYQAAPCFHKWFGIKPKVDKKLIKKLMKS